MVLNVDQKASRLFKKSLNVSETNTDRDFFEEPILSIDKIWQDKDEIPQTAPALSHDEASGVVGYLEDVVLTAVAGTTNSFKSDLLKNAIPFNYGDGSYNYTIKDNLDNVISFGQGEWVVDPVGGTLTFYGTVPANMPNHSKKQKEKHVEVL